MRAMTMDVSCFRLASCMLWLRVIYPPSHSFVPEARAENAYRGVNSPTCILSSDEIALSSSLKQGKQTDSNQLREKHEQDWG